MLSRQIARSFSTSLRVANKSASGVVDPVCGSFATFAEYREFIIKKDPESLKARFRIMLSDGKPESCPEAEAENHEFSDSAKKVAYNV